MWINVQECISGSRYEWYQKYQVQNDSNVNQFYFSFGQHASETSDVNKDIPLHWNSTLLNGGHYLPYIEKNNNSLGIVVPVHTWKNHGYRFPQEILGFYCGFESFMAGAILDYWSQGNIFKIKKYITKNTIKNYLNFVGSDSSVAGCWKTSGSSLINIY